MSNRSQAQLVSPLSQSDQVSESLQEKQLVDKGSIVLSQHSRQPKLNPALSHYNLGLALAKKGKLEEAINAYQKAIDIDSKLAKAYHSLGEVFSQKEQWQEAIEVYQKAIDIDPKVSWSHNSLGNALFKLEKFQAAVKAYQDAIELNLNCSWSHNSLGDTLLRLNQWDEAVEVYQKAIELNPDFPWSYYNLGEVLAQLGKWDKAIVAYRQALELNPELPELEQKLNQALHQQVKSSLQAALTCYRQAITQDPADIESYQKALEIEPNDPELHLGLGNALWKKGETEKAIVCYEQAISIDPRCVEGYRKLSEIYETNGQLEEATYFRLQQLNLEPDSTQVEELLTLGNILQSLGDPEEAVDFYYRSAMALVNHKMPEKAMIFYEKIIEIRPNHWQTKNILKNALYSNEQESENQIEFSDIKFDKVLNQDNYEIEMKHLLPSRILSGWEHFFERGNHLQLENRLEEATVAYYQSIVGNPLNSWSYHNLGDTHLKLGNWQEAIQAYKQAIKLNHNYFWSNYNLGVAYSNSGQWSEAIELYRHSVELNPGLNLPVSTLRDTLRNRWNITMEEGDALLREGNRDAANAIYSLAIRQYKESLYLPQINIAREIPSKPSVLLVVDDFLPQCLRYRVNQKIEQLEFADFSVECLPQREIVQAKNKLHFFHIVIFYRVPAFPEIIETIEYAKSIKKVVFYEIDDLIFDPHEYPDTFESYGGQISKEEYEGLVRGTILFREAMALCENRITSTPALAQEMEKVGTQTTVFLHRNALDHHNSDFISLDIPKLKRDYISIFYGTGTKAHNSDFNDLVAPAIARILEKYPQVRLTVVGYLTLPEILQPYEHQIDKIGIVKDITVYWEFLRQADINIAVLHSTKVNDCKSELKWFEAAVLGIPSVVSSTQTYLEVLDHGVDSLIASTPEEWFNNIEQLVIDENSRNSIAKAAAEKTWKQYSVPVMAENIKKVLMTGVERGIEKGDLKPRTSKKKLLIVNVFYPPQSIGGATRIVRDNVDIIQEKYGDQYDIYVFTSDDDNPNPYQISEYTYKGIHVTKVSTPMMVGMDWQYQNPEIYDIFSQYLEFNQPDLIHFHCVQRLTASVLEAAANQKIPYIVTIHDAWWISDHQFLVNQQGIECNYQQNDPLIAAQDSEDITESIRRRQYLRKCLEQANVILAVSETFAELYRCNGFTKTQSNRNGIMPRPKLPRKSSPSGKVRLTHVGGMAAHKGYFLLKEAVESTPLSNIELIVVNHAQATGTTAQDKWGETPVTFITKIPQEKMPEFYSSVDVLMAPSMWPESYGLVTREAAAAGVWVVASNKGALAEDLIPGVNGDVFDPDYPEELLKILKRIDQEPERYQQLIPEDVHVRTTEEQVKELLEVYNANF
jgi:tetratricopeptide (TPR) repeat protein